MTQFHDNILNGEWKKAESLLPFLKIKDSDIKVNNKKFIYILNYFIILFYFFFIINNILLLIIILIII